MNVILALAAAILFGTSAYLLLHRDLVRVVLGIVVISQAAVLTLMASALVRGEPPVYPLPDGPLADPLSQAMALTAIVIGMAVTALLLALVLRVALAFGTRGLDDLADEETERDAQLELERGAAHDDEEAAAQ